MASSNKIIKMLSIFIKQLKSNHFHCESSCHAKEPRDWVTNTLHKISLLLTENTGRPSEIELEEKKSICLKIMRKKPKQFQSKQNKRDKNKVTWFFPAYMETFMLCLFRAPPPAPSTYPSPVLRASRNLSLVSSLFLMPSPWASAALAK